MNKEDSLAVKALRNLKSRYDKGEVSALVGAGFSKNVSEKLFLSWSQLLEDMVLFTYESEIAQNYQNYRHINSGVKLYSNQKHTKNAIKEIIRRDGYLKIVDNYIQKKGFREAVETYIEERTPRIENFDDPDSELKLSCPKISDKPIPIPDNRLDLHHRLLSCSWENIFTTNYDRLLEYVVKRRKLPWDSQTITNSYQLSFRSKKPIIKIHGSLADVSSKEFCFDNDHNKRYVICSDDYDSYPTKHEAFTQYMRISLLRGCFCLFGFSGDDQNFISWTKWVRDILVKVPHNTEHEDNIKVFLLSINDDILTKEKQLFYDNHKIAYISLKNIDIKREIDVAEDESSISVLYKAFFDYLIKSNEVYSVAEAQDNDDYPALWRRVAEFKIDSAEKRYSVSSNINEQTLDKIIEIQSTMRFVRLTDSQEWALHKLYGKKEINNNDVKLIVASLKDMQLLPYNYRDIEEDVKKLNTSSDSVTIFNYARLRARETTIRGQIASIISDIPDRDNVSTYEQLLYHAFNLDFTSLRETLINWKTNNVWSQRRAILLALFNEEESTSLLLDYLDATKSDVEKYYVTDMLNYVYRTYPVKYPTVNYKHKQLDGIYDYFNYFIKNIKKQKEKITPLGDTRRTYHLSKEMTKYQYALRLLQVLADLGIPISLKSSRLIDDVDWYYAFKELYKYFPLATLYYSIQITDKDILRRIGQEYAYSDSLFNEGFIPILLDKLLTAYLSADTPIFYKRSILWIALELLIATPAIKWQPKFIEIWDKVYIANYASIDERRDDDIFSFIKEGLRFLTPKYCKKIIIDCITNAHLNRGMAVACLYYLKAKRSKTNKYEGDTNYQTIVNNCIENVTTPEDFTILGNIYDTLNKGQKERIAVKAGYYINQNIDALFPTYTLVSLSYLVKENKESRNAFKKVIINHSKLFYNGISENGHFSPPDFLEVSKISNNINWTQKELLQLYRKLSNSISALTGSRWFDDSDDKFMPIDHVPILKEMFAFLDKFQARLNKQESFVRIYKLVRKSLIEKRKFTSIDEALISNDSQVVTNGINELIEKIAITGVEANIPSLNLLFDRVLFKRSESLLLAINAVWYIFDRHKDKIANLFNRHLILILDTYKDNVCFDMNLDIPQAYSYFIKIALLLQARKEQSSGIKYWIDIKNSKRYNNIAG
jgi:hypothetical protein